MGGLKSCLIKDLSRYLEDESCDICSPSLEVTVANAALLSIVGLMEDYPILNTTIPGLGNPLHLILDFVNWGISQQLIEKYKVIVVSGPC